MKQKVKAAARRRRDIIVPEKETPIRSLLRKQEAWLKQQPEYPLVFLADRQTRRQAAWLLAKSLFTLPNRD